MIKDWPWCPEAEGPCKGRECDMYAEEKVMGHGRKGTVACCQKLKVILPVDRRRGANEG